ncbi:hypothetical protein [Bordetella bronchiseptica]|uniref:hypothetical protein n=1 Tax=Bordetella bronchiseptica TaxID=518 RepID=UPI0004613DCA|nr:hypothetical protein [Bordetella bronchiseptica]AWP73594.1 hypothetical protein B7P10_03585 [Bordetella bronchiseptica]KDB96558.1 hypothetical protein AZ23_0730 [Bordetella bronchiseptica E010]KDB97511.1 hypothetical protein AZ18_0759 [Bordetella bronchiseptica D993]KDD33702.1 hypothetical protein L527_0698 [Bordetella bronchiseptica MBORD839]KFJ55661.1 hypothetical protein DK45_1359 [Bordetella bronchiseptica]
MLNLMQLQPGQLLALRDGRKGEVVENMGDGIWVQVRWLDQEGRPLEDGEEELVHCEEVAGLA